MYGNKNVAEKNSDLYKTCKGFQVPEKNPSEVRFSYFLFFKSK